MARIKFLDVLEETKSQSAYRNPDFEEQNIYSHKNRGDSVQKHEEFNSSRSIQDNHQERSMRRERFSDPEFTPVRRREGRRNSSDHSEMGNSRLAFETGYHGRRMPASADIKHGSSQNSGTGFFGVEDNRTLWTGALFVFFGGMLFLSGYWLGKTITGRVKAEGISTLTQVERDYRREELNNKNVSNIPVVTPTIAATVDQTPVPSAPPKPVSKSVQPPATPKPSVNNKEFVIQVSAHSTIESARIIEDKLRAAGYSAYTSESSVGDVVYFRVRIRGFNNKNDAVSVLNKIKLLDIGNDGYVLSLE